MTQELIMAWFFGVVCGIMVFYVLDMLRSLGFWMFVFDTYEWVKYKIGFRK